MADRMYLRVVARTDNESLIRMAISAFAAKKNPVIEQLTELQTAISEAVTNVIVHAYPDAEGMIEIEAELVDQTIKVTIADKGIGIENIEQARTAFFTTKRNEFHIGMGFAFMEAFMDQVQIESTLNEGTKVIMVKQFAEENYNHSIYQAVSAK